MAPGGSNYQDIGDSRSAYADYGIAPESAEFKNSPFRKSAAVSGGKHGAGSNSAVHELLECPICMNPMYPPIHQCPNGHTLCVKCKSKVHVCPICRHELGNIRCLALEKIAESLELPCRYQIYGCQDIFTYHTRLRHEQNCRFRPYNCPYAGSECAVTGDIQYLVAHLKDDHKVDMHDGCTFNHRYVKSNPQEVENATWMLTVFNCFGHQFCLHFEAFNLGLAPVYMAFLRFMGDDDDAKRFSYSLEVGGFGRKLTWQGVPRSIRDSHKTVRDSLDGLIIQRSMALFFSGGDRKELKLKVGYSVHIGGLMRLDVEELSVDSVYVTVWASPLSPLHMGRTENVSTMLEEHFGHQLQPPIGEGRVEELGKWLKREFHVNGNTWDSSSVDIAASGLGWFAIGLKGEAKLGVWTYDGVDVIVRNALLPDRSHDFEVAGFTVSKIVSTADRTSNKQRRNEKKRKISDSTAEKPAEPSTVDVASTTC